jgi:hypothetical protein
MAEPFEEFNSRMWNNYIYSLNDELPADKCIVKLTEEEMERYNESLKWLKNERKSNPNIPISYSPVELDWD